MDRHNYPHDCIAASGFAIMHPGIAYELRPDLWASATDCARSLTPGHEVRGVHRMVATVEGYGRVQVLARSLDQLAQRLEWIIGRPVQALEPQETPEALSAAPDRDRLDAERKKKNADHLASLRKLAAEDPPSHDCHQRREILAARRELGMDA